jgi:hypothetical protein
MARERKKTKRLTIIVAATIVATLGGTALAFFRHYDYFAAAKEKPGTERAYQAVGMPWKASDLHPYPPISPQENAALLIEKAIAALPTAASSYPSASEQQQIKRLQNNGDFVALMKYANRYPEGLRLISLAAERPKLDFKRNWDQGASLLMPEGARIKWFVKRLILLAEAKAGLGDATGATNDLKHAWQLSHLVGQEPDILPLLVELSCTALTLTGIQRCSAILKNDPTDLQNLLHILDDDKSPDLLRAYRGTAYLGLAALRNLNGSSIRKGDMWDWAPMGDDGFIAKVDRAIDDTLPASVKLDAYKVRYLQTWTEMGMAMNRLKDDPTELGEEMDKIAARHGERRGESYWMSFLYPVFSQCALGIVNRQANVRATRALIGALLIRAKTGNLPRRIEDIAEAGVDPFSNQPMKLKQVGDSIRIYSIGKDRKDQGGFTRAELTSPQTTDDIVAAYPPVKLKL